MAKKENYSFYETQIKYSDNSISYAVVLTTSPDKAYNFYLEKFDEKAILYKPVFKTDYNL